jgi:hypothetical protein
VQFSSNDQPPITPTRQAGKVHWGRRTEDRPCGRALRTQQRARSHQPHRTFHAEAVLVSMTMIAPNSQRSTHERTSTGQSPVYWPSARPRPGEELLRKEVIQPHLPVRLPCYDFVPIAGPTFDSSFPCGLGHRLRVLPTFVT